MKMRVLKMSDYDIAAAMGAILDPSFMKKQASSASVKTAIGDLNNAAEILDNMGNFAMAEAVTGLMEKIAQSLEEELPFEEEGLEENTLESTDRASLLKHLLNLSFSTVSNLMSLVNSVNNKKPSRFAVEFLRQPHAINPIDLSTRLKETVQEIGNLERAVHENVEDLNDDDSFNKKLYNIEQIVRDLSFLIKNSGLSPEEIPNEYHKILSVNFKFYDIGMENHMLGMGEHQSSATLESALKEEFAKDLPSLEEHELFDDSVITEDMGLGHINEDKDDYDDYGAVLNPEELLEEKREIQYYES